MNLFYEEFPKSVSVGGVHVEIITDFREYIRLMDMLADKNINKKQKVQIISQYFLEDIVITPEAIRALKDFTIMKTDNGINGIEQQSDDRPRKKNLYSFTYDYPYILSAFMRDYHIDLETVRYLHWWKFRMLFDGLSDDTEIKQRIMYRGINIASIKSKEEKKRIRRIQAAIMLPQDQLTDYDIGNAFV
mgnify:FL=1